MAAYLSLWWAQEDGWRAEQVSEMPASRRATCKTTSTSWSALNGHTWTFSTRAAHSLSFSIHFPLSSLFGTSHASLLMMYTAKKALAMVKSRQTGNVEQRLAMAGTNTRHLLECRVIYKYSAPARMPSYLQIRNVASCRLCLHLPSQFFCSTCFSCQQVISATSQFSLSLSRISEAEILKKPEWSMIFVTYWS